MKYLCPTTLRYRLLAWVPLTYTAYAAYVCLLCSIADMVEQPAPEGAPWWLPLSAMIALFAIICSPLPGILATIAACLLPNRQPGNKADTFVTLLSLTTFITWEILLLASN